MGIVPLWQPSNITCTLYGLFHILCWKIKYDDDDFAASSMVSSRLHQSYDAGLGGTENKINTVLCRVVYDSQAHCTRDQFLYSLRLLSKFIFVFLARVFFYHATLCQRGIYMLSSCVCLSVTLRYHIKTANLGSRKQSHMIAKGLQFSDAEDHGKIRMGSPLQGRQMQVWWAKIGHFQQITPYNSKMVQDRRMVSIKVKQLSLIHI